MTREAQEKALYSDIFSVIRRYGHEFDLDISEVIGILQMIQFDVWVMAQNQGNGYDG